MILILGLCIILLSSFASAGITQDLRAHYSFENNSQDSFNSYNGINIGGSYVVGKVNTALDVGSYFEWGTMKNFENELSVCSWIKTNANSYFAYSNNTANNNVLSLGLNTGDNNYTGVYDGVSWSSSTTVFNMSSWNYLCWVFDGVSYFETLYNGFNYGNSTYAGSLDFSGNVTTDREGLLDFNGVIDELTIWERKISFSEYETLYNSGNGVPFYFWTTNRNLSISAEDYFNSNIIYNCSAKINETIYYSNVSTGIIATDLNNSLNYSIEIFSKDYFNRTIYHNISKEINVKLYQSIINISVINFVDVPVSNWSIYNGTTLIANTTSNYKITYLPEGEYNELIIKSNSGVFEDQLLTGFNVFALDNKTINLTIYDYVLNISAQDTITDVFIQEFNITIKDLFSGKTRNYSTSTGSVLAGASNSSYNISINTLNYSIYESSIILNITSSINYTFDLFKTNTINITFRDENTNDLITNLITIDFLGEDKNYNYSTSTGNLYEELLSPQDYTLYYSGSGGYDSRNYFFTLLNKSYNEITLYLANTSTITYNNVTAKVYDETNTLVKGIEIKYLKYSSVLNEFVLAGSVKTNFEGESILPLILNTAYYKFFLYYDNELVEETTTTLIHDEIITFYVNLQETGNIGLEEYLSVTYDLSFSETTNNFRFLFSDSSGLNNEYCLKLYENNIFINSTCSIVNSGIIYVPVTAINGTSYMAKTYVTINNEEKFLQMLEYTFFETVSGKEVWLFGIFLLTILFCFLGIYNIKIAVVLTPLPLFFGSILKIVPLPITVTAGLCVASIILMFLIKD